MNNILKQRLVGALILVALGLIFWPIIFVAPDTNEHVEPRPLPAAPAVPGDPVAAPDDTGLPASSPLTVSEELQHATRRAIYAVGTAPVMAAPRPGSPVVQSDATRSGQDMLLDRDGEGVGWVLQVATLSSAKKADVLLRQLLAVDQQAYVATVQRDSRTLYRVSIGPKFERAELERLQTQIDTAFGVKSLLVRYVP